MQAIVEKYPKGNNIDVQYGTAGFRTKATDLDHIVFRMGALAALRSRVKGSAAIGLMITASHNPEPDNGVKLVDPEGEMLQVEWESIATRLANATDSAFQEELAKVVIENSVDVNAAALVFVGRDTRSSSKRLNDAAIAGVRFYNGEAMDFGEVSTPMLHYFVFGHNQGLCLDEQLNECYFDKLVSSFKQLRTIEGLPKSTNYSPSLDFDGANGIGGLVMDKLMTLFGDTLSATVHNKDTATYSKLNHECGADYVKTHVRAPKGFEPKPFKRIVSVDGDADRVVYSYVDSEQNFHLLDGDRIASLVAGYLMELVQESGLTLSLGLVQTAYANGSSTKYITETMKIPVSCASTGVKHLHHKALEYDVGVYFEANGHGTVVFSDNARNAIANGVQSARELGSKYQSIRRLQLLTELINSTVGDAISDMLLVECVLEARGWSVVDWEAAYVDLPSRLMKVCVKDRYAITTFDADRKCSQPEGLQAAIDLVVSKYTNGRSFVRASGTEDVVRVYAEAATQQAADQLALEIGKLVHDMAAGIGSLPSL